MSTLAVQLDPEIRSLLDRLRRRIRLYIWTEGVAALLATAGVAFWLGIAFDWLLEPPPVVRTVYLMAVGGILFMVLYRLILARAFVHLPDASLALLLEKYTGPFDDSLLTAVQLASLPDHAEAFNSEMLAHTSEQARARIPEVDLKAVFNRRPLAQKTALALLLLISIGIFGFWANESFAFFVQQRVLKMTDARWPRQTRLVVEGFAPNEFGVRTKKIARGGGLDLVVKADNRRPTPPPQRVEVRYLLDDQSRGRADARRIGEAAPGRDDYQEYVHSFKDVFHSQTFDVVGGDDRLTGLRLEVVESPEIVDMVLHCEYPPYMGRAPRDLHVTGAMSIPQGTRVTLRAAANKPLASVKITRPDQSEPVVIDLPADAADRGKFEFEIPKLEGDQLLLFTLHDLDDIENLEPYRLALSATPDEAPQVTAALRGIGTAITPSASIPVVGGVVDDYGVETVWFDYVVNEDAPGKSPILAGEGRNEAAVNASFDVRPLKLAPQQKLLLSVKAVDRYDLGKAPNEGTSQRFLLDVVTPDQLRSMLESRELMLRRRFETIYADLLETRDLMARVDFAPSKPEPAKAEPSADGEAAGDPAARDLERRQVRILRSLQNVQRSMHETLAVATAFDEIHEELVNNRLDTEDLKARLKDSISTPLKEIGGPQMQELEQTLNQFNAQANQLEAGPDTQRRALAQTDAVLVAMKAVLDRMLELESYNEVMELLRAIIQDQEKINEQTDRKRKDKLRNLLDD